MRLVLIDVNAEIRSNFYPLSLSRPIWELRVGITNLARKLQARTGAAEVVGFLPEYMAAACRENSDTVVNDIGKLTGDDLLVIDARVKAADFSVASTGTAEVGVNGDGDVMYVRVGADQAAMLATESIEAFLVDAKAKLPNVTVTLPTWNYAWDLVLANPGQLTIDFAALGRSGIEGSVEQPNAIRGAGKDVYIAPGCEIHPMVVLDAANGPIYVDEGVEIHPFSRIEGPCYIGPKSILLGAKCREGNSIGPVCRIGGEVEESIVQGHSNKYHDGFLGHAYVGEWVNLGALTTNSDLKNDYGNVQVTLPGKRPIDTGSTKVGSLIGDHTKTSIGTLLNTGSYVGGMCLIMATGKPLAKFIPSFAWMLEGLVTKGFGRKKLYETAAMAMSRRKSEWTDAQLAMWEAVHKLTAPQRDVGVKKGRKAMLKLR